MSSLVINRQLEKDHHFLHQVSLSGTCLYLSHFRPMSSAKEEFSDLKKNPEPILLNFGDLTQNFKRKKNLVYNAVKCLGFEKKNRKFLKLFFCKRIKKTEVTYRSF